VHTEPSTGHVRGAPDWTEVEGWQPPDENDATTTATNTTGATTASSNPTAASAAANTGATGGAAAGLPSELPHIVSGFVSIFVVYAALAAALSWGLGDSSNNNSSSSDTKSSVEQRPAAVFDDCIKPLPPPRPSRPTAPAPTATVTADSSTTRTRTSSSSTATKDIPASAQKPSQEQPAPWKNTQPPSWGHGRGESPFTTASDTPLAFEKDAKTGAWVQQSLLAAEDAAFRTGSVPYSSFARLLSAKKRCEAAKKKKAASSFGQQEKEPLLSPGEVEVHLTISIYVYINALFYDIALHFSI
jgi:hypothetical protein